MVDEDGAGCYDTTVPFNRSLENKTNTTGVNPGKDYLFQIQVWKKGSEGLQYGGRLIQRFPTRPTAANIREIEKATEVKYGGSFEAMVVSFCELGSEQEAAEHSVVGRCKDCCYRDGFGDCVNEHFTVNGGFHPFYAHRDNLDDCCDHQSHGDSDNFAVGPEFGCVHFQAKD